MRAVLGANSEFPEAEDEEQVLRVGCSQTRSSSPAWLCRGRSDQNNAWVPLLWLCGCTDVVREGWKTAAGCSPSAQREEGT